MRHAALTAALVLASTAATAAAPEIQRPVGEPQGNGVVHQVRGLPEACAWIQGSFTGDAATPYRIAPVVTSPKCQARARLVDAAKAQPSEAKGWKLNDLIRIPSKDCAGLQAVIEIWRKPTTAQAMKLDGQGRARIYLQDAKASAGKGPGVTMYALKSGVTGNVCR